MKNLHSLVLIDQSFIDDTTLIEKLSLWRSNHQYAYPTRFEITNEGTARWLKNAVIENPNRHLYLIKNTNNKYIGHIGLLQIEQGYEIDNVLRGEKDSPGIMKQALAEIETIAKNQFDAKTVQLKVLKSNQHAVNFYLVNGYAESNQIPLTNDATGNNVNLVESNNNVVDYFIVMNKTIK